MDTTVVCTFILFLFEWIPKLSLGANELKIITNLPAVSIFGS